MEDRSQNIECHSCGAEYNIESHMDIEAQWCPFCSELIEVLIINSSEDYNYEDQ
jgi:hypothetical protein